MDNLYTISKYIDTTNTLTAIGIMPGISNILTTIAFPFTCAATLRCTLTQFARDLECGWVIWGKFGDRNRLMRIDSIQYDETVGTVVIRAVYADIWVMSHKIAADMSAVSQRGVLGIGYVEKKTIAPFKQQIANLYDFLSDVQKPVFADDLDAWGIAAEMMIFVPHLSYVSDEIGSVVALYRPAWQPDTNGVVFSRPRTHILQRAVGMCTVISSAKETAPTRGYGSGGGSTWTTEPITIGTPTYGSYFERIYDVHDVYLAANLANLTRAMLKQDVDNAQYWEIEVINSHGQDIRVGDIIEGDFAKIPLTVTAIDFEQSGLATRVYMRLGRMPVTVADRLQAFRSQQTRQKEVESLNFQYSDGFTEHVLTPKPQ